MSYRGVGFGQDCPGQEVFNPDIGVCMCPSGTVPTGVVGECMSEHEPVPEWGVACPIDIPILRGHQCTCPDGTAYDPQKNMCTREAFGPQAPTAPPSVSRPSAPTPTPSAPRVAAAGISVGAGTAVLGVVAVLGIAYAMGRG